MKVLPDAMVKTKEFPLQRFRIQQSVVIFALFVILVFGYLFFQYRAAFLPPALSVNSPTDDSKTAQTLVVSGTADSNATVTVNGEPASVANNGSFQKAITLFPGSSTITIKATNRFGKTSTIERTVDVQ